jgi:hypothetical protein
MGNKKIPDEVVTAMELAKAAGWPVSNRNKFVRIYPPSPTPDEQVPPLTIGYNPNDESMKVWRSNCRRYNLIGQGPARTPDQTERLLADAEAQSLQEADRLNAQRKAYEAEQRAKQQQIEAARQKADAATQQGLNPPQETEMPKKPTVTATATLFPTFDPALLGTRDSSKFLLANDTYYCVECLAQKKEATFKAPQGLAAHRSRWHQLYNENIAHTQEISRVSLPADVDTAFDMLRSAMAEALEGSGDPEVLAAKEAELAELKAKLEAATKQAEADRKDFDTRYLEAQVSADKRLAELLAEGTHEANAKREAEIEGLMKNFMGILVSIREATETLSPIQAIAKIDTIVSDFLKK